jgi:hypothetical protein
VLCFRVLPRTSLASPAGHSICNSRPFNSLRTLFLSCALFCGSCRLFSTACALFCKNTRVGVPLRQLCALCGFALSLAVDFVRPLFSSIYELPPHGIRLSICNLHRFMQLRIALFATPFDSHRCKLPGVSSLPSPPYPRASDACSARSSSQLAPSRQFSTFNCRTVNFRRHNAKIHPIPL